MSKRMEELSEPAPHCAVCVSEADESGLVRLEGIRALRAVLMAPGAAVPPAAALALRVLRIAAAQVPPALLASSACARVRACVRGRQRRTGLPRQHARLPPAACRLLPAACRLPPAACRCLLHAPRVGCRARASMQARRRAMASPDGTCRCVQETNHQARVEASLALDMAAVVLHPRTPPVLGGQLVASPLASLQRQALRDGDAAAGPRLSAGQSSLAALDACRGLLYAARAAPAAAWLACAKWD